MSLCPARNKKLAAGGAKWLMASAHHACVCRRPDEPAECRQMHSRFVSLPVTRLITLFGQRSLLLTLRAHSLIKLHLKNETATRAWAVDRVAELPLSPFGQNVAKRRQKFVKVDPCGKSRPQWRQTEGRQLPYTGSLRNSDKNN